MDLHSLFTVISLSLTIPTIIAAGVVIVAWWESARRALSSKEKTQVHWFVLGVTISFLGSMIDNFYWGMAWTSHYFDWSYTETLFNGGVYSNTIFRQVTGIIAALCHIKASSTIDNKKLKWGVISLSATSVIAALVLILTQ